jgi:putative glutamine amidotransferase
VQHAHPLLIEEDSRLARLLGPVETSPVQVNSSHHQAIARPGEGLRAVATSPVDGVIEALEATDTGMFAVAVQWHPERSYETSPASRALFAAFLDAASARSLEERE